MATHSTTGSFVGALRELPGKVDKARRAQVQAGALHVTTSIRREIAAASGGDNRLSGVGRRGAKVGVGFDLKGFANPTALVQARGPLHLIERSTKPHTIRARARRRGGRGALKFGISFYRSVQHPGTSGKHPFAKGVAKAMPTVGTVMRKAFRKTVFGRF